MALKDLLPEFTALGNSLDGAPEWRTNEAQGGSHAWVESFAIRRGPISIVCKRRAGSQGATAGATFRAELSTGIGGAIELRAESFYDRLGKRLRINRELQLADPDFDRAVYVLSDLPDDVIRRALDLPARDRCRSLVLKGATVKLDPQGVALEIPKGTMTRRDLIEAMLEDLVRLHEDLSVASATRGDPYGRANAPMPASALKLRLARGLGTASVLALLVLASFVLETPPMMVSGAHLTGLAIGGVLWAASFVVLALLFRGRASSLSTVSVSFVVFVVLVPFGSVLVRCLNAAADRGTPTEQRGEARHLTHKRQESVLLHFAASNRTLEVPYGNVRLPAGKRVVDAKGSPMVATIMPGAFGWQWVQRVDIGE